LACSISALAFASRTPPHNSMVRCWAPGALDASRGSVRRQWIWSIATRLVRGSFPRRYNVFGVLLFPRAIDPWIAASLAYPCRSAAKLFPANQCAIAESARRRADLDDRRRDPLWRVRYLDAAFRPPYFVGVGRCRVRPLFDD